MKNSLTRKIDQANTGYLVAALVGAFSLFMGFFVLPYVGARSAEHSALVGLPAPDFLLPYASPAEHGKSQRLSDLQGRVVVLDFWASWCGPCRAQTPVLENVARSFGKDKLQVLGVGTDDEQANIVRFLTQRPPGYPSVYDEDRMASSAYKVSGLPTLVVIAKDGTVRAHSTGLASERELSRLVSDALK